MNNQEIEEKLTKALFEQNVGNFELSNTYAEEIFSNITLDASTSLEIIEFYIDSLLISARNYRYLGNTTKAIDLVTDAKKISEIHKHSINIAKSNNILGLLYNSLSEKDTAMEYFNQAIQTYIEVGNSIGIASVSNNIGIVYDSISDYENALKYYSQSLEISEQIQDLQIIAASTMNIGIIYKLLGKDTTALEYYQKALNTFEKVGNKDGIANVSGNIGNIYSQSTEKELSLEWFLKALKIYEENSNQLGIAISCTNIGIYYKTFQQNDSALEYYKRALFIHEDIQNKKGIATALLNIGIVYLTDNSELFDISNAEDHLKKALSIALEISNKETLKVIYEHYSDLYSILQKHQLALEFYKKSIEIEKEIHSEEATNKAQQFDQRRKLEDDEKARQLKLARFQEQEKILHNILPSKIADRILSQETFIADHFESVSVMFMDLVGFTSLASIAPPKQLVYLLDAIFQKADEVLEQFGLEKIKTIGDGYLAVANVTTPLEDHQKATALAALQLLETMKDFVINIPEDLGETNWIEDMKDIEIRIGIHSGEVVAGIIGKNKYTYDLWGDAVNIASRMESNSEPGRIHVSEEFAKSITSHPEFSIIPRGEISIKGKGIMKTYWLEEGK